MPDNPYTNYFQQSSPSAVAEPATPVDAGASGSANPYANYFSGTQPVSKQPAAPMPVSETSGSEGANPYANYFGNTESLTGTGEHDESDRFTQLAPDAGWFDKAKYYATKPIQEYWGWGDYRHGAGWGERALEKTASGIFNPLGVALVAAFAPAGLAEGVAGATLKTGLTEGAEALGGDAIGGLEAAAKVEQYGKAVLAARKAEIAGSSIKGAVDAATEGGMPYQEFLNYGQYLRNQGLSETDILPESLFRQGISRAASTSLKKVGVGPAQALRIAKGMELAVNAGFTVQAAQGALYAYPRFLDLMQNGQYDDALEYLTEGTLQAGFAGLGVAGGLHAFSDLLPAVNEAKALPLDDSSVALRRFFDIEDGTKATEKSGITLLKNNLAGQIYQIAFPGEEIPARLVPGGPEQPGIGRELGSAFKEIFASKAKRQQLEDTQKDFFMRMDAGNDPRLLHQMGNILAYAYGQNDLMDLRNGLQQRTPEEIEAEEKNNILLAEGDAKKNDINIKNADNSIASLTEELKTADPQARAGLQASVDNLTQERNAFQLKKPTLDAEYAKAKEWQNPTEETWKNLYDELNAKLHDAARPIDPHGENALDQFNQKVRALGLYPKDLQVIEEKFPNFRKPEPTSNFGEAYKPLPEGSYLKEEQPNQFNPNQRIFRVYSKEGGLLGFGYSPEDAEEDAITQYNKNIPVTENRENPFYYKSEQIVNQKITGPTSGPQVLKTLQNSGVKPDELYWTGLEDLLKNDKKFTKQELLDHIASHQLGIEEVTLGSEKFTPKDLDRLNDLENRRNDLTPEEDKERSQLISRENASPTPVKYSRYTLPGGENQRELLLTMPPRRMTFDQWRDMIQARTGDRVPDNEAERKAYQADVDYRALREGADFRSSHWDEPNVLAHVRLNDRTTPDGKHLLHIEELQSDWHQQGRTEGYREPLSTIVKKPMEARREKGYWEIWTKDGEFITNVQDWQHPDITTGEQAVGEAQRRLREEAGRTHPSTKGVPDAPFKKTWPELLVKRMVHYAAENGYDGVSWTPGEEQNKRYSLSQVADRLDYDENEQRLNVFKRGELVDAIDATPEKLPSIIGKEVAQRLLRENLNANALQVVGDFNGNHEVIDNNDHVYGRFRDLEDAYGYIRNAGRNTFHTITGDSLEVGGSGMRGFYDKIVPDIFNNIGKKFGTKVDKTEIGNVSPEEISQLRKNFEETHHRTVELREQLDKFVPEQYRSIGDFTPEAIDLQKQYNLAVNDYQEASDKLREAKTRPSYNVQYLPLNQELKDSVLNEGQPLFNRIYPPPMTEAEKTQLSNEIDKVQQKLQELTDNNGDDLAKYKKAAKLAHTLDRLQTGYEKGTGNYFGEVHQLPDGKRVLYVPLDTLKKIQTAIGFRKLNLGEQIPKGLVDKAQANLEQSNPEIAKLFGQAINEGGDVVISRTAAAHGGRISRRLHTLREELNHSWQSNLGKAYAHIHLDPDQFRDLSKSLDKGIVKHLNLLKYNKDAATRVVEASAKMMSVKDLSTIGTTPEDAAAFLHKYFTAIKDKYGEGAFDNLVHVTNFAKRIKEEFLHGRETEPESTPQPGETETALEGVGTGGGGGTPEGPKPTGPPGPDLPWWRADSKAYPLEPWQDGPTHAAIPSNISEMIAKARTKAPNQESIDYVREWSQRAHRLATTALTPEAKAVYDALVKAEEDNWTKGYLNEIIHSIVPNHIHHIWGEDEGVGNNVIQHAAGGSFAINASQARHRSYGTILEGLLQNKKLKVFDPASLVAHDANNIAEVASNRRVILALKSGGLHDVEGMPLGAFYGRGYVVPGEDGTKASVLVNPNIVRNIEMQPDEIQRLKDSNLLNTYLKDGRVVDRTGYATIETAPQWIDNTEKKLRKLEEENPLLHPGQMKRHVDAWAGIKDFAQTQARKIADYLDTAIGELEAKGPIRGQSYAPLSPEGKPSDINMTGYLDRLLHGQEGRNLGPGDIKRLKDLAERRRLHSEGESSYREGPILPHEIAELVTRERSQLKSPELNQYLKDVHQKLGTDDGKGLRLAISHIAHAAENKEYPQLTQDLLDLKYVYNVLTPPKADVIPFKQTGRVNLPPPLNPITQELNRPEAEARLQAINDRQPKKYLWAPKSHIVPDHPAFRGYKWMATAPDGTPTLAESDLGISRHIYKYVVNRLGIEPSWLRKTPVTAAILKGGAYAKNTLLSLSPFHITQEALRALMLHTNPLVRPNPLTDVDEKWPTTRGDLPLTRLALNNGLTVFTDRHMAENMSVGVASHGGLVSAIPVFGRINDQIHDFLFNRYIPDLKVRAFRNMFNKYAEAHPDWSNDAVAARAADHTNNAFGGINWRAMGRSATTQDWFHLVALAPDWLESEMRFMSSLFRGVGIGPSKYEPEEGKNISRTQVAQAAAAMWVFARMMNQLTTGNPHYEAPFGLAHKDADGKETIYSVRTLPTDMLHMVSDPYGFLVGRESPFVRTAEEAYTGRNQYGQKLTEGQKYVDLISNLVPIGGQAELKKVTNLATSGDVGNIEQGVKALGATAAVYRTPAQLMAANLAAERSEEGQMNPAKIARHRLLIQLEDDLRSGRIKNEDLATMIDYGNLPIADAKAVIKNVKETAGEDPEMARMYSRVSRLDFEGAVAVYDAGNIKERQILEKLITKKAKAYLKKARTDFTPDERNKDPMFKRARQLAPVIEPETENAAP